MFIIENVPITQKYWENFADKIHRSSYKLFIKWNLHLSGRLKYVSLYFVFKYVVS